MVENFKNMQESKKTKESMRLKIQKEQSAEHEHSNLINITGNNTTNNDTTGQKLDKTTNDPTMSLDLTDPNQTIVFAEGE